MKSVVIISGFPTSIIAAEYLCLGDFMARLRYPDKTIVYLNQVEEHIDMEQDRDTNRVRSILNGLSLNLHLDPYLYVHDVEDIYLIHLMR